MSDQDELGESLRLAKSQLTALKRRSPETRTAGVVGMTPERLYGVDPGATAFECTFSFRGMAEQDVTREDVPRRRSSKSSSNTRVRGSLGSSSKVYEITSSAMWNDDKSGGDAPAAAAVAVALNFGGSIDEESESFVRCGDYGGSHTQSDSYTHTFEEEDPSGLSTPPRSRSVEPRPSLTDSPSTTATAMAGIAPVLRKLPVTQRVAISPTREKDDSELPRLGNLDDIRAEYTFAPTVTPAAQDEWKQAKTPEGKSYYYNRRTRESSWKAPTTGIIITLPSDSSNPKPLRENDTNLTVRGAKASGEIHKVTPAAQARLEEGEFAAAQAFDPPKSPYNVGIANYPTMEAEAAEAFDFILERINDNDTDCFSRFLEFCATERALRAAKVMEEDGLTTTALVNRGQQQCPECGRSFARSESLHKHLKGCKTIMEKRVPSDSSRRRVFGTPMDGFVGPSASPSPSTPAKQQQNTPGSAGSARHHRAMR